MSTLVPSCSTASSAPERMGVFLRLAAGAMIIAPSLLVSALFWCMANMIDSTKSKAKAMEQPKPTLRTGMRELKKYSRMQHPSNAAESKAVVAQPSTVARLAAERYQVTKNISSGSATLSMVLPRANCRLNLIWLFPGLISAALS